MDVSSRFWEFPRSLWLERCGRCGKEVTGVSEVRDNVEDEVGSVVGSLVRSLVKSVVISLVKSVVISLVRSAVKSALRSPESTYRVLATRELLVLKHNRDYTIETTQLHGQRCKV